MGCGVSLTAMHVGLSLSIVEDAVKACFPPSSTLMVRADRAEVGPVDQGGFLEGTAGQLEPGPRFSPYLVPGPGTRGGAERLLLVPSPLCSLQPRSDL